MALLLIESIIKSLGRPLSSSFKGMIEKFLKPSATSCTRALSQISLFLIHALTAQKTDCTDTAYCRFLQPGPHPHHTMHRSPQMSKAPVSGQDGAHLHLCSTALALGLMAHHPHWTSASAPDLQQFLRVPFRSLKT